MELFSCCLTKGMYFHFALGATSYVAGPAIGINTCGTKGKEGLDWVEGEVCDSTTTKASVNSTGSPQAGIAFTGVLSWGERISLYALCLPVIKGRVTWEGGPPRPGQLPGRNSDASLERTSFLRLGNECLSPEGRSGQINTASKSVKKEVWTLCQMLYLLYLSNRFQGLTVLILYCFYRSPPTKKTLYNTASILQGNSLSKRNWQDLTSGSLIS